MRKNIIYNSQTQKHRFYHFLLYNVATSTMVSEITKIPQKNLCRYKRELEKKGKLWCVYWAACPITGRMAWHLTTNPSFLSIDN
jgi:hypothetical protein